MDGCTGEIMSRLLVISLMLLPCPAAFAHSDSNDDSAVETTQARPADMREDGAQHRETTAAERKPGIAEGRNNRAPQRWHGFLPGMFR